MALTETDESLGIKSRLLPMVASVAVGVLPSIVLIAFCGVPRRLLVGWGVLSYILGVTAFKMPLYHLVVVRMLHGRLSHLHLSITQGLLSALTELGAAWLFFVFVLPRLPLVHLIGFGMAAGLVEAIMLPFIRNPLKGTPLEQHSSEVSRKASGSVSIAWYGVLERVLALFPHTACRGLVYVSVVSGNIIPAVLAVLSFALIDGRAYYAHLEKWPFDDPHVLGRLYGFIAMVAAAQTLLFALAFAYLL